MNVDALELTHTRVSTLASEYRTKYIQFREGVNLESV